VKKIFLNIALTIASVTLFFLAAELAFRLIKVGVDQTGGYLNFACFHWAADKYKIPLNKKDDHLFWRCDDRDGVFRGRKHEIQKDKDEYRVLCLGDSTTQGFALPPNAVSSDETYPYYLEQILDGREGGIDFDVINAGCGGYSSFQGLRFLERDLLKYQPNLIIVGFGINDSAVAIKYNDRRQAFHNGSRTDVLSFLEGSHFFRAFRGAIFFIISKFQNEKRVSAGDFEKNLKMLAKLAKEHDATVVFLQPALQDEGDIAPLGAEDMHAYGKVFERLREEKYLVIDVASIFNKAPDGARYFVDVCHTNPAGNKLLAEEIYDAIHKNRLLP